MNKQIFDSRDFTSCPHGRRYYNTQNDACRMCEYRDDCPLDPDDFDPDMYYDDEDRDVEK